MRNKFLYTLLLSSAMSFSVFAADIDDFDPDTLLGGSSTATPLVIELITTTPPPELNSTDTFSIDDMDPEDLSTDVLSAAHVKKEDHDALLQQYDELNEKHTNLRDDHDLLNQKLTDLEQENAATNESLSALENVLNKRTDELAQANTEIQGLVQQLKDAQEEVFKQKVRSTKFYNAYAKVAGKNQIAIPTETTETPRQELADRKISSEAVTTASSEGTTLTNVSNLSVQQEEGETEEIVTPIVKPSATSLQSNAPLTTAQNQRKTATLDSLKEAAVAAGNAKMVNKIDAFASDQSNQKLRADIQAFAASLKK